MWKALDSHEIEIYLSQRSRGAHEFTSSARWHVPILVSTTFGLRLKWILKALWALYQEHSSSCLPSMKSELPTNTSIEHRRRKTQLQVITLAFGCNDIGTTKTKLRTHQNHRTRHNENLDVNSINAKMTLLHPSPTKTLETNVLGDHFLHTVDNIYRPLLLTHRHRNGYWRSCRSIELLLGERHSYKVQGTPITIWLTEGSVCS